MATLPDVTALPQAQPQPSGAIASYEPPNWRQVGMVGEAFGSAGRNLESASEIVATANQQQDTMVAQSSANTLANARAQLQFDPQVGFTNVREGNAVGPQFVQGYLQRFDQAQQAIRENLANPNQQRIFDQHAQVQRDAYTQSLLEHQARETNVFNDKTDDATLQTTLGEMARDPQNDLTFARGQLAIKDTIDRLALRKGLPKEDAAQLYQKYMDAAYSTRVLAIANGLPGVRQGNPYAAESMFTGLQADMSPAARAALGNEIQRAIVPLQQRDLAYAIVHGSQVVDPRDIAPAAQGAPLQAMLRPVVQSLETGGLANPEGAVSPKGAQGAMQVMPATAANPGFGVRPAQLGADGKPLPGELERVGNDYLGAMTARYQDPALILAAYNAGPGQVDKWIAQHGDPRMGGISDADWAAKIPFSETKDYVSRGLTKVPTAAQVKAEALPALMQKAGDAAAAMYPNDPTFRDGVIARAASYFNQMLAQKQAQQQAAGDTLTSSLVGQNAPTSIDQALSNPDVKAAFEQATPEAQLAYQTRLARGDKGWTRDSMNAYYGLLGLAANDPEQFSKVDLMKSFDDMPTAHLQQLMGIQKSISQKEVSQQQRDLNWQRATANVDDMLKPMGLGKSAKANTAQAQTTEQFYGRFQEAIQQYHDANQKYPDTATTRQIASGLLTQGAIAGGYFWDTKEPFFQAQTEGKASKFYVPLPGARTPERAALVQQFQKVMGRAPNDTELQEAYTRYKLAGGQ